MIKWQVNDSFTYVPLNVNCISTQGPASQLGHLILAPTTVEGIKTLCLEAGNPIVFDFSGIQIFTKGSFEILNDLQSPRLIVFVNVNSVLATRLKDDGVSIKQAGGVTDGIVHYWVANANETVVSPADLNTVSEDSYRYFMRSQKDVLIEWNKLLPSTPVYSTKYYDVKKLCVSEAVTQIIAMSLANLISKANVEFDFVVSSSYTGAFIAVPVSTLLGKHLHCWTDFGPKFNPKRRTEWAAGKGKQCLLVADFICMGTEVRAAQAFITATGSRLVACAAIATYLPPSDMTNITLLGRTDLEQMGYRLTIPSNEAANAIR